MKCFLCHTEHAERCAHCLTPANPSEDSTTINCFGFCRVCQRLFSFPRAWRKMEGERIVSFGCYFPSTDMNVNEWGQRGTGIPQGVEWDQPANVSGN